MTFEEAKKILEKEFAVIGIHKSTEPFEFDESGWIEHEKPSVLEAFRVLSKEGYYITISGHDYNMRKKRLEKEYEKNVKAPGPGEEQSKEGDLKAATKMFGAQAREIMRLTAENAELRETIDKMKEGNPALKEALKESATQFNDALLDEQGKKIEKLANENERLKDQIAVLDACKKHNDKIDRKQIKCLGKEIAKLNGIIHDKNAVLADVAEELRLSKIREKNLTELCQKYVKEVEDLREQLADKVVDKIDAQALKSAESALAYKEKVIDKLTKENNDYKKCVGEFRDKIADMTIGKIDIQNIRLKEKDKEIKELNDKLKSINENRHNELAEKDEVIADLGKELEEKTKLVEMVRKGSKEYCEYGIAAEKMIQKMAKDIVNDRPVSPKDYEQYRRWAKGYRFNPQLPERTDEEEKKPNTSKSTLDDLKEKAYNSFNAKACNLGLVGSKDGNGIFDQMIGVDIAEEGEDHSGVIVLCGKDFIDSIKKMK